MHKQHAQDKNGPDVSSVALKPEWVRLPVAVGYSGIGRSSLYELISANQIRSAVIRKPGNIRGIRIISVASLDAYLNKMADAAEVAA